MPVRSTSALRPRFTSPRRSQQQPRPEVTGDQVARFGIAERVILTHGFAASASCLELLRRRLAKLGYEVECWSYPSMTIPVADVGRRLHEYLLTACSSNDNLHFVTHSMGALAVLVALEQLAPERLGRCVFLAPPLCGTPVARFMPPSARSLLKPLQELRNGADGLAETPALPPASKFAVIAGRFDFRAPRAYTSRPETSYHCVLNHTHNSLLLSRDVVRKTDQFLRFGNLADTNRSDHSGDC